MEKLAIAFLVILGIVILSIILAVFFGFGFPFTGNHTGYITAVERGGMFDIPNLYLKTDTQSSQEDLYCLSEDLYQVAQDYSKRKNLVTVEYARGWFMPFWSCNSANYRISEIYTQ